MNSWWAKLKGRKENRKEKKSICGTEAGTYLEHDSRLQIWILSWISLLIPVFSFWAISDTYIHIMRDLSHLYLYNNLNQFIHALTIEHNLFSINHRVEVYRYWFPFRMKYNQYVSLCLVALVLGQAASLPQYPQFQQQVRDERKFAEKPNAMKKVALDDLDDISTNQIQVNPIRDVSLYYKKISWYVYDIFELLLSKKKLTIKVLSKFLLSKKLLSKRLLLKLPLSKEQTIKIPIIKKTNY